MPNLALATSKLADKAIVVPGVIYYLGMFSATPGRTGAHEASGGSYVRQAIVFGTPNATGISFNTDTQTITTPTTVSAWPYLGLFTAATGGSFKWAAKRTDATATVVIGAGQKIAVAIGEITAEVL